MDNYWKLAKSLPNDNNHEIINDFLLSLKLANRSKNTLNLYRGFLERFFGDIEESYSSLSSERIQSKLIGDGEKIKDSSLSFRISVLSSFYTFCVEEELIERSPIKKRWFPRLPQPVPKYLDKEDIAKIRIVIEKKSLRNQALLEFLLTSGCRVAEVAALNIEDIDLDNRIARVVGKGKKIRQVHFTEKCLVLLERYIDSHPKNSPALFVSTVGKRITIRAIQLIIQEIGEEAGLSTRLHTHRFRHTFATSLLAKGADISFISDELGHSDIGTTQIYARLPKEEIVVQYRKFMR